MHSVSRAGGVALLVAVLAAPAAILADSHAPAPEADAAIAAIDAFIASQKVDKSGTRWKSRLAPPPQQSFDAKKSYFWKLETSEGDLRIKLMPEIAPMHVTSLIYLTRLGYYDGTPFHRVIPRFMAQGGDPTGSGMGGPGYSIDHELSASVKHDRKGLLSAANTGRPKTDGSQFFLTFVPTPHLNGKHSIYGEVVDGMPVLDALEKHGTSPGGKTIKPLILKKASISVE